MITPKLHLFFGSVLIFLFGTFQNMNAGQDVDLRSGTGTLARESRIIGRMPMPAVKLRNDRAIKPRHSSGRRSVHE